MKKKINILFTLHIFFWLYNSITEFVYWEVDNWIIIIDELLLISLFYINYFFLAPSIIKIENNWTLFIWALVFLAVFETVMCSWRYLGYFGDAVESTSFLHIYLFYLHISFYYGGVSLALRMAYSWMTNEEKNKELSHQKTLLKIDLLKSSINIPFMRKTLQWMQEQFPSNSNSVESGIIQLSDLLRYGLYRSQQTKVFLSEEIKMIEQYLNLRNEIFTQNKIYLIDATNVEGNESFVIPNFFVRNIGNWLKLIENSIVKDLFIEVKKESNTCSLIFPFINDKVDKVMQEQLLNFSTDEFEITTGTNDSKIILSITTKN